MSNGVVLGVPERGQLRQRKIDGRRFRVLGFSDTRVGIQWTDPEREASCAIKWRSYKKYSGEKDENGEDEWSPAFIPIQGDIEGARNLTFSREFIDNETIEVVL